MTKEGSVLHNEIVNKRPDMHCRDKIKLQAHARQDGCQRAEVFVAVRVAFTGSLHCSLAAKEIQRDAAEEGRDGVELEENT